jgi:hypothetical protein
MTTLELRAILKNWITQILITENGESDLIIIASHQNAPAPSGPYIVINQSPNSRDRFGRASKGETKDDGTRVLVSDWVLEMEIREYNGVGDRLEKLVDSLDREDIQRDYFQANNLAHYNQAQVLYVPRLLNEEWENEALIELQLGKAEGTTETTSFIETVDYTANI